jgi:hypothetical protein
MRTEIKVALIAAFAVILAALIPVLLNTKKPAPPDPVLVKQIDQPATPSRPVETPKPVLREVDQQGSPYSIEWRIDPLCHNFASSEGPKGTKLQCHLNQAGIHIDGDNTAFNLWSFGVEAPGPISAIKCTPTGSNEPTDHPEYNKTSINGNSANCTGLINGGDGDVIVDVKWQQSW